MDRYRHVWAKSPRPGESQGESLADHSLRVWHNFLALRERMPILGEVAGDPRFWLRSALAVALHDLGKCSPGFQAMLRGRNEFGHRHEILSLLFVKWLLRQDPEGDLQWVAAAVLTHHKDFEDIYARYRPADVVLGTPDALEDVRTELCENFYETAEGIFRESLWPRMQESGILFPSCIHEAAGTMWIPCDGVRELREVFDAAVNLWRSLRKTSATHSRGIAGRFARGILLMADHAGSAHVTLAWTEALPCSERMAEMVGLNRQKLWTHQRKALSAHGNAILTAPTGSGKTEAALLWAASVGSRSKGQPVLFYVLPYQASINAMHKRLEEVLGRGVATLQHSRAIQAVYRQLLDHGHDAQRARDLAIHQVQLARLHATPIRILTPYQLLRAAFQVKGHEAIWTDCCGSLIVFDEIHGYEPARLGMILATLRHLVRDLGVRAFLMSATLPARLVDLLGEALGNAELIEAELSTQHLFRRHRVELLDADLLEEGTIGAIATDLTSGKAVLAVATTVGRAQQLWRELHHKFGDSVQLLHGRFHAEDRFQKELVMLKSRGNRDLGAPGVPMVLVATQVVEVSLDISFDVLYSDPAPLEALFQRFGRVNRWPQPEKPLCDVRVMRKVPEGSPVYDAHVLAAALKELDSANGAVLNHECMQAMLDHVYGGELGLRWESKVREAMHSFEDEVLSSLRPFESDERIQDRFEELFGGYEVLPRIEESRYLRYLERDPLMAPSLFVPVTSGQFWRMRRAGVLERRNHVWVADCPYSFEEGLQVPSELTDDGV